ncbi:hypothetical protein EDB85DRAFT_2276158, partial [Lactarius pseudohatsudake]
MAFQSITNRSSPKCRDISNLVYFVPTTFSRPESPLSLKNWTNLPQGCRDAQFRPRDPGEVSFSCRERQGAVLSLPVQAESKNTRVLPEFGKWIIKHIDLWFAWSRQKGLEIYQTEDIVLVTGTDRTKSWANVAFLGGRADARVTFGVEANHPKINWKFSPERKIGAMWNWGPSGEDLPDEQCIFIRGFRVRKRMILRPKLKAAAGPNPDLKDDDCEPDAELISIPAVPKYRDPLHVILEHIAEERPNCDMAIVHDDDLALLDVLGDNASLETLQSDVLLSSLRSSKPTIHEVVLGPDPLSGRSTDLGVVRVASVSATFERQFLRISDSESGRIITTRPLRSPLVTSELPTSGTKSSPLHAPTPSSHVKQILDVALNEYKERTGNDLLDNWISKELQTCDSAEAVLNVIQHQAEAFHKFRGGDKKLMMWIGSSVHVLYTISAALGEGVGMALLPAKVVFTAVGVLLAVRLSGFLFVNPFNADISQAAKDVRASHDALVDLFDRIQFFLNRLGVHTRISPTKDMVEILVKIMAEVIGILSIATKEMQRSKTEIYLRKLLGRTDIEDALKKLDGLTQEEVRMAIAQVLQGVNELKDVTKKVDEALR